MKCPLRKKRIPMMVATVINDIEEGPRQPADDGWTEEFCDCIGEKCMWWDKPTDLCAIVLGGRLASVMWQITEDGVRKMKGKK